MSKGYNITRFLRLFITLCVAGWLAAACSDSKKEYPESLEKAISLFYLENKNDSVLTLLSDENLTSGTHPVQQLSAIFRAAAICEAGYPDSAMTILSHIEPEKLTDDAQYYYGSIRGLIEFRQFKSEEAYITLLSLDNEDAADIRALALNQRTLGRIMLNYGDYKNAIDWLLQSRRSYEKAGLDKSVAINDKFIGNCCVRLNLYDEAHPYLHKAISSFIKHNDGAELFYAYVVMIEMNLRQNRTDTAEMYIRKARQAYDVTRDKTMQALLYNNRGEVEKLRGNYPEAILMFDSTLMLGAGYYYSVARRQTAYLNLADVYNKMKLPDLARKNALDALNTVTESHNSNLKYAVYYQLAKSYTSSDAVRMQTYLDSAMFHLHNYNTAQSVDLIRFYDTQEELHQTQHRIEELKSTGRKHRTIYLIFAFVLLVIITALARIFQVQKERNKVLRELVQKNLKLFEKERHMNEQRWEHQKTTNSSRSKTRTEEERSKIIYTEFIHWLADEENFRRNDLTLEMASRELNTNREYLSRAISYHRAHFTDLVNKYRVQEVMKVFSTPADARNKLTLQVLATEVGFNSNSVFIDAFRKVTGMTPTQFREHLSENSTQPTS